MLFALPQHSAWRSLLWFNAASVESEVLLRLRKPRSWKGLTAMHLVCVMWCRGVSKLHICHDVCKASRKWHTSKSQPPFTCDCGVSSSGSRTLSVGGAPQAREVCVVPQEQCGVVTLCDLPGPPEPLHHCLKRNGIKRKKINTSLTLPWQRHRLPQGGANVFWIQDPPFPKKVTGGCPCCLATGQYPQLPKFLESEPTYENKAWDLLSEQDQSL